MSFGLLVAVGALVGVWLFGRELRSSRLPADAVNGAIIGLLAGLAGAKLLYVAEHLGEDRFFSLLLSRGGLSWFGGLFAGICAALAYFRWRRWPILAIVSAATPALAVGHALGRVGCFLVGDDYGVRSTVPWAVAFPNGLPPTVDPVTGAVFRVHPTMLYETLWLAPVALLLWLRRGRSPFLFGEYLVLAGLGRLWIEGLRRNPDFVGALSNAQVVALSCIAIGAVGWLWMRARGAPVSPDVGK